MKRLVFLLPVLSVALASAAAAQSTPTPSRTPTPTATPPAATPTPVVPTTVAAGTTYTTENSARVSGVRLVVDDSGGVWFIESGTDRIGVLRGTTVTYWQLRNSDNIGANPVDIRLDGDNVWILETGQSLAPAGTCTLARLNTVTNALDEWVVPGSIPGNWYQAPDGKYWFPMSGGTLQSADFTTGVVVNHRSPLTYAYSDMTVASDGAMWMVDFGNNRIVRYVPDAETETFWGFPNVGLQLNPSQVKFDDKGTLWICQLGAGRIDRFDPVTNVLYSYYGISNPIHFDFFQGKVYVTSGQTNPAINVIDPSLGAPIAAALTPQTLDVNAVTSTFTVTTKSSTATKSTFTSTSEAMPADGFTISSNVSFPGVLVTQFPPTHAFGMAIVGGDIWTGQDGKIANVRLQTVGGPTDPTVPASTSSAGNSDDRIRVDITLSNKGTSAIGGEALYMYSPATFAARATFTVAPGATQVLTDAFGLIGTAANVATGSVRIRALTGTAGDLVTSVRSTRIVPGGKTWGYAFAGQNTAECLGAGSETTLFTGGRSGDAEVSILGLYSPSFATGTMTLLSPSGAVRGTRAISIAINTREEYNPAASAFGVEPEPGDVVRVSVATGALQAYVNVLDLGTIDAATRIPITAGTAFVIPVAGEVAGVNGQSFVSDLQLSNPAGDTAANVTITYSPIAGSGPVQVAPVGLPANNSVYIADFLPTLFGISTGQGAVIVSSDVPIALGARIASRVAAGDYGGFAAGIPNSSGIQNGSAIAIGLPQTSERRTNLLLYNAGAEGSITVTGFKADGAQVGPISVALGAQESGRLNSVFAALGVSNQEGGRIRVDVPAAMKVYAWTAEVDGQSGDVDIFPLR